MRGQWALFLGVGELRRHSLNMASLTILGVVTVVLGAIILLGAILVDKGRPREGAITVLAFAVLSVFTGGGYLAGLILGVIGGAIILAQKQSRLTK